MAETATKEFLHNLRELPQTVKDSCFRLGKEPESEREESQATPRACPLKASAS